MTKKKSHFINNFNHLFFLLFLILVGYLFSVLLTYIISFLIFKNNFPVNVTPENPNFISVISIMQICSQIGIFILPSVFFAKRINKNSVLNYLRLEKTPFIYIFFSLILIFVSLPFIATLAEINKNMKLPLFMKNVEEWIRNSEINIDSVTKLMLNRKSFAALLINIIMIALLPAIGEELMFRSVLINIFKNIFKSYHIAILFSAVIFSAFHFQFFGFLPRFALGVILGYIFVYSESVIPSIIAHFCNNFTIVMLYYLNANNYININIDNIGNSNSVFTVAISLIVSVFIMFLLKRKSKLQFN